LQSRSLQHQLDPCLQLNAPVSLPLQRTKAVTQFDNAEYPNANNNQNDIAVMSNFLPLLPAQAGSSIATATPLNVTTTGSISTGRAQGAILQLGVAAVYWFTAVAAGTATFTIDVLSAWAAEAAQGGGTFGRSNLDVQL
jgi:hypothetical protein